MPRPVYKSHWTIEKGVPIPPPFKKRNTHTHRPKYPWSDMVPGDSFFVPDIPSASMSCTVATRERRNPGEKYTVRARAGGVRVWKTQ